MFCIIYLVFPPKSFSSSWFTVAGISGVSVIYHHSLHIRMIHVFSIPFDHIQSVSSELDVQPFVFPSFCKFIVILHFISYFLHNVLSSIISLFHYVLTVGSTWSVVII
jgi:hypothetical protein